MLLVCFHCAGCDGSMFSSRILDGQRVGNTLMDYCTKNGINVLIPNLPGRAEKSSLRLTNFDEAIDGTILNQITAVLDKGERDWGLVGHSMGGICCHVLYHKLCLERNYPEPRFVVLSASWDPSMGACGWPKTKDLNDHELKAELTGKWGMNARLTPQIWNMLKDRVRRDMEVIEEYNCLPTCHVNFPVLHFVGENDHYITLNHLKLDGRFTSSVGYDTHVIPSANHALYHNPGSREFLFQKIIGLIDQRKRTAPNTTEDLASDDEVESLVDCF